ncbi:MAG TPA: hypothetical protein VFR18_07120, partial [Terriglobia bacterium]|nr:hypothetical protein [Terriglobia bacterium]
MNLRKRSSMNDRTTVLRAASRILLYLGVGLVLAGFLYTDILEWLPDDLTEDIIRLSLYTAAAGVVLRFLYPLRYANALLL